MTLRLYLKYMAENDGDDLFISPGAPPCVKVNGKLVAIENQPLTMDKTKSLAYSIMKERQVAEFEEKHDLNFALSFEGVGRFRVNVFMQQNTVAMVVRNINTVIPEMEGLGLPSVLKDLVMSKNGLLLFVGSTGSGKSTSLASLIDYRNKSSSGHIITIEDPIEFVHTHKRSIINQREVGIDVDGWDDALKNALRQAPDVILIGEIRSRETMEYALNFAETGHLVISTLHANNANQALDRIINFFPEDKHAQVRGDMSLNVRGIISQRLIPNINGKRNAAVEIMINSPRIADLILDGDVSEIKEVMERSNEMGMQTFDQALYALYDEGKITLESALGYADSANNLRLKIQLKKEGGESMTSVTSSRAPLRLE